MRLQKIYKLEEFEKNLPVYIQKKEREIKTVKEFVENQYPNKS